jgi:hypothetical protein
MKYSSRCVPVRSRTNTQAISTSPAPALYQCPVPLATPTSRSPPPYQATVSDRKSAAATAWRGLGRRAPLTGGRPLPRYGGGGSNRLASGWSLLTSVNRARWRWANRASSWVP